MTSDRTRFLWLGDGTVDGEVLTWLERTGPSTDMVCAAVNDMPLGESTAVMRDLERRGLVTSRLLGERLREWSLPAEKRAKP